tara:strand:- start:88 stop:438 length:351 start_codon:yes stop_codon:yes gene_type:complete
MVSIKSWLEEFGNQGDLQKWIGLRKENLKKHGLKRRDKKLYEYGKPYAVYSITTKTCDFCKKHYRRLNYGLSDCSTCPLFKIRNAKCFKPRDDSPYAKYINKSNPEPMIELIRSVL